ncbi:Regulator of nucleoside diphosphate kinase [subsurface metagenome]
MNDRIIYITEFDLHRLEELLEVAGAFTYLGRSDLKDLEEEVSRAQVVDSRKVPHTVITMNSRVKLRDLDTGEEMVFTLVFPREADIDRGRLSVISPVGTAILGYTEGDTIEWKVPSGKRRIKIEKVLYQPEAAGDYHL